MRFGIQTGPQNVTWPELVNIWKVADRTGFDTAWTFDHFFPIMSDPRGPIFEGWIALTALAAETTKVRVGCLVTGNTYRHPPVLAQMGASLDVITNGRLNFGIGAAWFELEHRALDIEFPSTGERIRRLDEACEVIKQLWTQKVSNFEGTYYRLKEAYCEPKPVQKPYPPIMIGGAGEKLTLRVVAKHADQWNAFGSPETIRQKIQVLEQHCADVGRDPSTIEKTVAVSLALTRDASRVESLVADIASRRNANPEELKGVMLWGGPQQIVERISEYRQAGVEQIILSLRAPYDPEMVELFAQDVIPAIRQRVPA
jgi:F420-dependent oxidoreductase-like protein